MSNELTTAQVAERLGVGKSTVNLWCRQNRFPNARSLDTPRGPVWLIPESDLEGFTPPQPGRPPKPKQAAETTAKLRESVQAATKASGSDGRVRVTKKGGGKKGGRK
ncbi:MAG: helix-turn-helix domain-containing protein [Acidobacteriota bacterium]|nr:helix-turn-helix domain-containing protein [Acidobacteriota bacterium]